MIKYQYLNAFIERLNTYQIVRTHPFLTLYAEWFIEVRNGLENEVYNNILLSSTDKTTYLEYVKKRILDEVAYQNDEQILDKWIKNHQLERLEFPFSNNEEVQRLLATDINQPDLDYETKKLCTNMQMDFYCHAAMGEKFEMIAFIDKFLEPETKKQPAVPGEEIADNSITYEKLETTKNPHPQIFSNTHAYGLFQTLFEQFKTTQNKIADFSFIYRQMYKDGLILDSFKPQMFINWINKEPYNISLDKLKTLDNCSTTHKVQTYNTTKELLQIK